MRSVSNRTKRLGRPNAGFIVIDMGLSAGIIAVLIGLLLPAVQAAREAANRSRAEADVKRLCSAALATGIRTGQLPAAVDGYTMFMPDATPFRMIAEPVAGITGKDTVLANVVAGCPLTIGPAPGAGAALTLMLENTMISGFAQISRISDGTSNTIFIAEQSVQPALNLLAGTDGLYIFASIQQAMDKLASEGSDPKLAAAVNSFVQQSFSALQLGANEEQWKTLPGIPISTKAVTVKDLFNLDTLSALTQRSIDRSDLLPDLLSLIQARALDGYIAKVTVEADPALPGGAAFTGQEAQALVMLARLLR